MTVQGARSALALLAVGLCTIPAAAAEKGKPVGVHVLRAAEETYFAVRLRADRLADVATPRDHVVLVDTSASQIGEHRRQLLEALDAFLAALPAQDRVRLFAVDLRATPMMADFAATGSPDLAAGVAKLRQRAPMGATDLLGGLRTAGAALNGGRPGSIVYFGDGMSAAALIKTEDLARESRAFRERRIPVHSYAAGPDFDLRVLGALAVQTGGVVLFDNGGALSTPDEKLSAKAREFAARLSAAQTPEAVGQRLAAAATAPVFYPERITLSDGLTLLPTVALPLRGDRTTIYVGTGEPAGEISVSGTHRGEALELAWELSAEGAEDSGQGVLYPLWQHARRDGGLSVSIAGDELLRASQDAFDGGLAVMLANGQNSLLAKDAGRAREIGLAVLELDPANVAARALIRAAEDQRAPGAARVQVAQVNPAAPPANQPAPPADAPPPDALPGAPSAGPATDLIGQIDQLRRVRTEEMRLSTSRTIEQAERLAVDDPVAARLMLEQQLVTVQNADIFPADRRDLARRLELRITDYKVRAINLEQQRQLFHERLSRIEAEKRLVEELMIEELRIAQLIDQVRALLEEGVHGNDDAYEQAEAVARVVVDIRPGMGPSEAALFTSEAAGQLNKAFRLRKLRDDRFLETLYQVELSHVPFPDEPPIRFPPAAVWQALTERRKRWAAVDLHKYSPREEQIISALRQNTDIAFADTPLEVAMQVLADLHDIPIILDRAALAEESIQPDTPINHVLSGLTLRSALKIILDELQLTYVIQDEVMKITTQTKAADILSTRVYPVGDLVVPIQSGGGLGGLGMMGMGMMGMGGMGMMGLGGYGGLGMMGGGMGMMGLGGGFYSVPPEANALPAAHRPANALSQPKPRHDADVDSVHDRVPNGESTSTVAPRRGQFFAQIQDVPFDNRAIEAAGKKKLPAAR